MRAELILGLVLAAAGSACSEGRERISAMGNDARLLPAGATRHVADGDARQGRILLQEHACNTCHMVPGQRQPAAHVGPPLIHFAKRTNIGGSVPNEPEYLVRFIMNAPQVLPGTSMPDLSVSEVDARHIAAFLYTLQ